LLQKFGQPRDIHRNPPRLIARELGRCARIIEIDISERLSVTVADNETGVL
jgi:hypothetical protein